MSALGVTAGDTMRKALAEIVGGYRPYVTTSSGSSTTFVISGLSGIGSDYVLDMPWALCASGNNIREFRRATGLSGTTVTVSTAFTNTVASGVTVEMYPYRLPLYKQAWNKAFQKLYPSIRNDMCGVILADDTILGTATRSNFWAVPRNIDRVSRVSVLGGAEFLDNCIRANSTTAPGSEWTVDSGTWGISSNKLYSVTDTDADAIRRATVMSDGFFQFTISGTTADSTDFRTARAIFRRLDSSNYLCIEPLNSTIYIQKKDAGTFTNLTSAAVTLTAGTDYVVSVLFRGRRIQVWVDGVWLLDYNLIGGDVKYLSGQDIGFEVDKGGAPGTALRLKDIWVFNATLDYAWTDWRQSGDSLTLEMPHSDSSRPTGLLYVEGTAMLTLLTADATTSLASDDATPVVELAVTSPVYQTLLAQARAEFLYLLGAEIYPTGIPENSRQYTEMAIAQEALVKKMRVMPRISSRSRGLS